MKTPVALRYSLTKPLETIAGHQIDVRSMARVRHGPACRGCIGSSGCLLNCPSAHEQRVHICSRQYEARQSQDKQILFRLLLFVESCNTSFPFTFLPFGSRGF